MSQRARILLLLVLPGCALDRPSLAVKDSGIRLLDGSPHDAGTPDAMRSDAMVTDAQGFDGAGFDSAGLDTGRPDSGPPTPCASEGAPCSDGNFCTTNDVCRSGACVGAPRDCSALTTACSRGVCDPTTGGCVPQVMPNRTPCDDNQACTQGDACVAGVCQGGATMDCSALDNTCSAGVCVEPGTCTTRPREDGGACDDDNPCTDRDQCIAGVCAGTPGRGISGVRINEVYGGDVGGAPDYIELINTGSCPANLQGVYIAWNHQANCAGVTNNPGAAVFDVETLPAGGILRIVDLPTGVAGEVYVGSNFCDHHQTSAWVALCDGVCSLSSCTNYLDYFAKQGASALFAAPSCASMNPAPLNVTAATADQSATRIMTAGGGAMGRSTDWALRPFSR